MPPTAPGCQPYGAGRGVLSQSSVHNWVTKIVGSRSGRTNPPPTPSAPPAVQHADALNQCLLSAPFPEGGGRLPGGRRSVCLFISALTTSGRVSVRLPRLFVCLFLMELKRMIHVVFSDEPGSAWGGGASQLEVTVMNFHKQPRRPHTRQTQRRSLTLHTRFFLQRSESCFSSVCVVADPQREGGVGDACCCSDSFGFSFSSFFFYFPPSPPLPHPPVLFAYRCAGGVQGVVFMFNS